MSPEQRRFFDENGYLHVPGVLDKQHLERVRAEFDTLWAKQNKQVTTSKLLASPVFLQLTEHESIRKIQRGIFGKALQLLQYDLLFQGPESTMAERSWHRDFTFPGDYPVSVNTIIYLDDMDEEVGPTRVVPGTHRGPEWPPKELRGESLPGEVPVYARAGDAIFINASIWHTGGRNKGQGLRRGIYMYVGYWWMRPFGQIDPGAYAIPWQALENASQERLAFLGYRLPLSDINMYDPSEITGA